MKLILRTHTAMHPTMRRYIRMATIHILTSAPRMAVGTAEDGDMVVGMPEETTVTAIGMVTMAEATMDGVAAMEAEVEAYAGCSDKRIARLPKKENA